MESNKTNLTIVQISPKKRPEDRFISSRQSDLSFGTQQLKLICVVEIVNHWNHAREIGSSLEQMFAHFFNQSRHNSVLTRFEDALKQINKVLINAQAKVGTTISCLLALHVDNDIYFSTVGDIKILLIRDGKLTSAVTSSKDKKDPDEVGEFTSVTSGSLNPSDWIIYANDGLFEAVRKIVPAKKTIEIRELENQLRQTSAMLDKGTFIGCGVEYTPNTGIGGIINLDEPAKHSIADINFSAVTAGITTGIKSLASRFAIRPKPEIDLPEIDTAEAETKPTAPIIVQPIKPPALQADKQVTDRSDKDFTISHYSESPSKEKTDDDFIIQSSSRPKLRFSFRFPTLPRKDVLKNIRHPLIAGIIFLIVLAGISYYGYRNFKNHNNANTTLPPTPALISSLKSATPAQTRTLLASGLTQDRYQVFSTSQQVTVAQLAKNAGVTIDQLPSPLFAADNDIAQIAVTPHNNYVYAIDKTGQLYFWDGKTLTKENQASLIASPVSLTALAKNEVVATDSQNNIYLFDGSSNQPILLTQPSSWASGLRYVQNYNTNLYILTASDGTVHRIPGFINTIANDTTVVSKVVSTNDTLLSFLINGDINTLTVNTGLVDHPRSKPAATVIMPDQVSNSSSATFDNSGNIEVNNGSLISTYSSSGEFQSAIGFVLSSSITEIADDSPQGLLVVIGSKAYQIK